MEFRVTHSTNRRRPELSGKVAGKRGGLNQRQKLQQQSSRTFRENIVNDRRNIQGNTNNSNSKKQSNNRNQQRRRSKKTVFNTTWFKPGNEVVFNNRNQRNRVLRNEKTRNRRYPDRSFEERLQHAEANAPKLTVVVNNPHAELSPLQNPSVLDLIQTQLNNICALIENHSLPELDMSRLQRIRRSSIDNGSYQSIEEGRINQSRLSDEIYNNHSTASDRENHSLLFTIQNENRLDIPVTKVSGHIQGV
ncbi:Hypothetical predicted protein [Paramuricea clavata]|uniref:Uncharacterized protein n=1 Tax=Paramuricea clavata TaxID=317549 RepID=A0A7D9EIU3_PARCT|nr:Hypothetical predicted protein [Paramuricea clavata]